ncbi:MAG: glycosyltransferase [Gemmatimonadetes bacterium]|nr:glycosyltransferase [Gemmatimonadota bacterium]
MRVVHVDPATSWRGGERQVLALAEELARQGIDGTVVASPNSPLAERAARAHVPVETVRAAGDLDPLAIARIGRIYRRHRPDVVHLHTARAHAVGGIAARLTGTRPVVVTRRLELPARGAFGRWKYRHLADHYIAISEAVESSLLTAGVPKQRVRRIPSGIPLPLPATREARSGRGRVIGTLAAFTPQKDPAAWVETVRRCAAADPDLRFVWAGEGELRGSVEVAIREAGLEGRVRLPGFLADLDSFWAEVDVFLLTSAFEALGTVLLDAMAHAVPIVATPVGGIPEVVRDGREGRLAGDPATLAAAVAELVERPEERRRLGAAGRARAEEYRLDHLARRVADLYEELAGARA